MVASALDQLTCHLWQCDLQVVTELVPYRYAEQGNDCRVEMY